MLMGEYHHNIDDKGRLIIPSKFRNELGNQYIITKGLDKCLFVYSIDEWNKLVKLFFIPYFKSFINANNNTFFINIGVMNER